MDALTKEWAWPGKVLGGFKFVFRAVYKRAYEPIPRKHQKRFAKDPAELGRAAKRTKFAEEVARERFSNLQRVVPVEEGVSDEFARGANCGEKVPETESDAPESDAPTWKPCEKRAVERVPEPAFQGTPYSRKISHLKRRLDLEGTKPGDDIFNEGTGSARLPTIREEPAERGRRRVPARQFRVAKQKVTPRRSLRLSGCGQNVAALTPPRSASRMDEGGCLGSGRSVNKTSMPWIP
ncbi:hypothetical protein BSKO_13986 [Bryopsis sp. KO-2023]|nr:hypothetical protein BSKO_13986 [Bryopsis sp. KO-2023]